MYAQEAAMRQTIFVLVGALSIFTVSPLAAQQTPERSGAPSGNAATSEHPGQSGKRMDDKAAQGSQGNQPDTLMDKRAKAMSPDGASSPGQTGKVSQ
jgi:hypothetical protein